jgi:hypothetical protein
MTPRLVLKNASLVAGTVFLALSVAAHATPDKKEKQQGRLLYGKVLDQQDNPVAGAIVYLTNTRTHAVPGLSMVDYEVYAQYNGRKSDTKSVSQFDDRSQVYVDLKINTQ